MGGHSRGNTAIGALLLITTIGVGALTFDGIRAEHAAGQLAQSSGSMGAEGWVVGTPTVDPEQRKREEDAARGGCGTRGGRCGGSTSMPPPAPQPPAPSTQNQSCTMGFDYIIQEEDVKKTVGGKEIIVKEPTIKPTLDGQKAVTDGTANQCLAAFSQTEGGVPVVVNDAQGRRTCDLNWACRVYYCVDTNVFKPSQLKITESGGSAAANDTLLERTTRTESGDTGSTCKLIGSCAAGQKCDVKNKRDELLKPLISKALTDPDQKVRAEGQKYLPSLGSSIQEGVDKAFKEEITYQEEVLQDRALQKVIATQKYDDCYNQYWKVQFPALRDLCKNERLEIAAAQADVKKTEDRLKELRTQAATLQSEIYQLGQERVPESAQPTPQAPAPKPGETPFAGSPEGGKNRDQKGNPDPSKTTFTPPPTEEECRKPENRLKLGCERFSRDVPPPGGRPGGESRGFGSGSGGGGLGQFMPLLNSLLGNFLGGQKAPTCKLTANPTNITQPGQPVTLSWTSENAQSAYISNAGQVGPTGSITVNPQQSTTYTMQVIGFPQQQQQQQQNPYGGFGSQGGYQPDYYCVRQIEPLVVIPNYWGPECYNGRPSPPPAYGTQQQTAYGGYGASAAGPPQQGQCSVQVTVGAQGSDKPKAQISCQPKAADVGMQVAISYACQNASASKGDGFTTNNQLSGSVAADVVAPPLGSQTQTYTLTCSKEGQMDSAQCTVQVFRPAIVLVANPKSVVRGESANIGWLTTGMDACVISSPNLQQFTQENANNTSPSGVAKTPPLVQNTSFELACTTKSGATKSASTTVEVR